MSREPKNRVFLDQTKTDPANVFRGKTLIGTLDRTRSGAVFEYDSNFLSTLRSERSDEKDQGIAFHLPYSRPRTETSGVNLHPFFAGLLPEGLRLKALIKKVKTSEDDLLSLLIASGSDCIGDIFVMPADMSPGYRPTVADVTTLEEVSFSELFKESISQTGKLDQVSIPGVQDKVSASMISFPFRARKDRHSYILKLNPADRPKIIHNEYFFLQMADACGLKVNQAKLVRDRDGAAGLLIKRFDRVPVKGADEVRAIHQEDACQFLNRYPADKYRISTAEIAEALQLCSAPIVEVGKLIRLKAFSYLIANGDLHAKNVSIYISPETGRTELTPAYDLLSTLPYGDQRMALKLEGKDDNLKRKNFVSFGKRFDVKEPATHSILDELCDISQKWIERLEEIGLDKKKTTHLRQVMLKRRDDLA